MKATVSEQLADYACAVKFEDLPAAAVHQAKRLLLKTLTEIIGGYSSEAGAITRDFVRTVGGNKESTVIGDGFKTSCQNAVLANGVMLRFLDMNDTIRIENMMPGSKYGAHSSVHPDENIPTVLAVGERVGASGREILTSIVLAYELSGRLVNLGIKPTGFHFTTIGQYVVPMIAGRLMGLNRDQIANAVGIAGTYGATLGIVNSDGQQYDMTKNIVYPLAAYNGILAAFLAQKGFTGPKNVIEGPQGLVELVLRGNCNLGLLTKPSDEYQVFRPIMKSLPANGMLQTPLIATLKLIREHKISPEDVESITVEVSDHAVQHVADPGKRIPETPETADHSGFYVIAVAIRDGKFGGGSYDVKKKLGDDLVRRLMDRIVFKPDEGLRPFKSVVTIRTKAGSEYKCKVDVGKGAIENPMTDEELVEHFASYSDRIERDKVNSIAGMIFNLDRIDSISELTELLVLKT